MSKEKLPCGRPIPDWRESHFTSKEKRFDLFKKRLDLYVAGQGLNQSFARTQILEVISGYESHFTPSQLIEKVLKKFPKIGSATVYRSIQVFVGAGILRETFSTSTGETVFEVESSKHHDHIVCMDCDAILEFHEPKIEEIQAKVLKQLKFREAKHRHVIYVRCEYRQ